MWDANEGLDSVAVAVVDAETVISNGGFGDMVTRKSWKGTHARFAGCITTGRVSMATCSTEL